jgi:hypothetical protein
VAPHLAPSIARERLSVCAELAPGALRQKMGSSSETVAVGAPLVRSVLVLTRLPAALGADEWLLLIGAGG